MKEQKERRPVWSRIFELAGERRGAYVLSVVLAVLSVLCSVAPYLIAAGIINRLLAGDRAFGAYLGSCALMALCWFFKQGLHSLSTAQSHRATFFVLGSMRKRALERLAEMPLGDVNAFGSGNLKNILVERIDSIETTLAHILPEFTSNLLVTVLMLACAFAVDWRVGLVSLVTFPLGFVFYMGMMIDYKPNYERTLRATTALNDATVEYIGGIEVIKVFGKVKGSYEKFVAAAKENANSYIDWMKKSNVFFCLAMSVVPAALITVLPVGLHYVANGSLARGEFVLLIMLTVAVFEPLITCMSYSDDISVLNAVMGQITEVLDAKTLERPESDRAQPEGYTVTFEGVRFGYGEKEVLHGIDLTMEQGQTTALVGLSGSGKSTIARLLASFWDVDAGAIRIGGADVRDISADTYYQKVAYVSQDSFLFDESVMENIRMGRPDASDEEVMEAAKSCGCHDFIMGLENGYQTPAGGSGDHLSGGERQRICIARAMLKNAPIIILDEATAYTDPENEAILQEAIARLTVGKTLIVIAHRLSTIAGADKIVVVNGGNIEDTGTHEELLGHHGLYEAMWRAHISVRDSADGGTENV